jgi:L-iditol 2-dehydrogenase
MRAAVLYDIDDIRIEERPIPELRGGDLLVRTLASGICSGDVMPWYIRRKAPLIFGHEPAGEIVALGDPAPLDRDGVPFRVGERVFVHHHAPCFACRACQRGDYVQCATWRASKIEPGAMAEYFRVPRENLGDTLRLPDDLPIEAGSLVEPLACVVKSLRRAHARPGDVLYMIGLGVMGLLHVALARAHGHVVFASDFAESRRIFADAMGAQTFDANGDVPAELRERTDGRGAEIVICGPGNAAALDHAIASCAPGGTVVQFTPFEPGTPYVFDQSEAYFRDLTLVASYSCGPDDTLAALAHLKKKTVAPSMLGETVIRLDDVAAAYADLRNGRAVKPIVVFS